MSAALSVAAGPLVSAIYISSTKRPLAEAEILEILNAARANNERLDVTGMLLYREGNFLQILEGPAESVDLLLAKIKQDPRHGGVVVMSRCSVEARQFGNWPMAFRNMSKPTGEGEDDELGEKAQLTYQLLNLFKLAAVCAT